MQHGHIVAHQPPKPNKLRTIEAFIGSKEAIAEINAYIAIRDDLLAEAEQIRSTAKIDSVSVANDFLLTCLKPARHPYETQSLPVADAARERKRCQAVNARLAELRATIAKPQAARVSVASH